MVLLALYRKLTLQKSRLLIALLTKDVFLQKLTIIGNLMPNLTLVGIGKCKKWLHDLSQTLTDIRTLKL